MKICKLKLKNVNSFRESVEIDFEKSPLDDASLVAITGPTGAGKTTLLDAICVALYGKTPRLSGSTSQHPRHLISHGEKEAFAEVLFRANGTRYLATWAVRQKGSPKAQLFYADDRKLISDRLSKKGKFLSADQNTVSEEVESILGLDFDAFTRSVMLTQGEFAAFLKADKENRRNILEATAGVHIYDILREELNRKVAEVKAAYDEVINKLKGIPEASHDQLKNAEAELDSLQKDSKRLGEEIQQAQEEKARETKRTEEFEELQSSKKRREELSAQQSEIDVLQEELENANRAQRLLPEKREFNNAQSEYENSEEAFRKATIEKTEVETQVEAGQAAYDEKAAMFEAVSTERDQKMPVYTAAKLDVERATERFAEADKRTPELIDVNNQIDALENQLTDRQLQQTELQRRVDDNQRFLEDNPLPLNRQQRLTQTTRLLVELTSQEKQLETALTSKTQHQEKMLSLKREIEQLSNTREERLSEKADAETKLENADAELKKLLAKGTSEEWDERKQQVIKATPLAQRYETVSGNLADSEDRLRKLNIVKTELNASLKQIETELTIQMEARQHAVEAVEHCEASQESALLANSINQLRQHLHTGEPCLVCGATEHPYADVMEPEGEERLQNAKTALVNAKAEAQAAQNQLQTLKTKQAQIEENKNNTVKQIEDCRAEIEALRNDTAQLLTQWQKIYPDTDISSDWIVEQIAKTDIAVASLSKAKQTYTQASHDCQTATQNLKACENDIDRETRSLEESREQLKKVSDTVEDLQAEIGETEDRLWVSMPNVFHGVAPAAGVKQFSKKIEAVEKHEDERDSAKTQLQVLNANIEADQHKLQDLKDSRETLKNEKDAYLREGETYLSAAREETGGLDTEDEIDKAINALEADLKTKKHARDGAEQQLQNSQKLLTQKQAAHKFCENQFNTSVEKLSASRKIYFNKLKDAGFGTAETHNNAFRDDDQIQDLTARIDMHEDELQRIMLEITELQTRFEETPYDPDALGRIETQLSEIETQVQEKREKIGAQNKEIDDLKDNLKKREVLAGKLDTVKKEMERWQRLQETIPASALRDFALEIMFRQMGNLANTQLRYLTSDRYELKVESIGDLSVVDRWNANQKRPVETLSGGESFLTSLALALALSELSSGRAQLNSLFLDEGFGTLDSETLDIAIAALEGLRMQGRRIFLISHIQELTRRLPVKIQVNKKGNGSSSVDVRG